MSLMSGIIDKAIAELKEKVIATATSDDAKKVLNQAAETVEKLVVLCLNAAINTDNIVDSVKDKLQDIKDKLDEAEAALTTTTTEETAESSESTDA